MSRKNSTTLWVYYYEQYQKGQMALPQIAKALGVSEEAVQKRFQEDFGGRGTQPLME